MAAVGTWVLFPTGVATYPGLWKEGMVHTALRMHVNLTNFWLKPDSPLLLCVTILFEFLKPQAYIDNFGMFQLPVLLWKCLLRPSQVAND